MHSAGWIALFATIVAAPLLVATLFPAGGPQSFLGALAAAAGWVAFALLAAEFALVTRVRAAAAAFGSDVLLLFHRLMALAALAFLLLHVALLAPRLPSPFAHAPLERSGALAGWAVVLLIVSTVWRRRLRWSHELWLVAHRILAVAVVVAGAWHVLAALEPGATTPRAVVWTYTGVALTLLAVQRIVRPLRLRRRPWEVVENREEGASTRTLVLRAVGHAGLRFAPGQFVWIATPRRGLLAEEHPITIASSPELDGGRTLELAIKALGDWSREVVPALRPGQRVRIDGPFGAFTGDAVAAQRLVLVAGGVGVTPMRSMLLAMRDRGDRRPAVLFFAAHDRSRAMFADELERLRSEIDLQVVFVFEVPGEGARCEHGFLTADILRRHLPADLRFTSFFVCGPVPMMKAFEHIAHELGIPAGRIHTERFDVV